MLEMSAISDGVASRPTLLCGAGISLDAGLPDGQEIATSILNEIWSRSAVFESPMPRQVRDALTWRADREPELRLELVLELLAHHLDPATLVRAFAMLDGATATRAHLALALAPTHALVTTNQDLLLEQTIVLSKRSRSALHLHGDCRHPSKISTLISQYVIGLKRRVNDAFKNNVRGRHVVVLGYSGRDRDIMPYLYDAARITWLHFHRKQQVAPLSTELQALIDARPQQTALIRTNDPIGVVENWLSPSAIKDLNRLDRVLSETRQQSEWQCELPLEVRHAYRNFHPVARDLALARVLSRLGQNDLVLPALQKLVRRPQGLAAPVHQALGNIFFLEDPQQALLHYRMAGRTARDPVAQAAARLSIANLESNRSRYKQARQAIDQAMVAADQIHGQRARSRLLARILARSARMHIMTDNETASLREYRRVRSAARRAGDIDTLVEGLTFGSDPLRSRGRYHEALALCEEAMSDAELYATHGALPWALFYRGNCLGAMYRIDEALSDLVEARRSGERTGHWQLVAWASVTECTYLRTRDLDGAEAALKTSHLAIKQYGQPLFACSARVAWEQGELSRARRQFAESTKQASKLADNLESSSERMPYLEAHVAALRAELARDTMHDSADELIGEAIARYHRGRWAHCEARMRVSRWLLRGGRLPKDLLARCEEASYGQEALLLRGPQPAGYVPLHVY
jgi:tetratricopeptide (TPR) repeat protein